MKDKNLEKSFWIYFGRCDVHWNLPRNRERQGHQIGARNRAAFCKQQGDEFKQTTANCQEYSKTYCKLSFDIFKYSYHCKNSRISVIKKNDKIYRRVYFSKSERFSANEISSSKSAGEECFVQRIKEIV